MQRINFWKIGSNRFDRTHVYAHMLQTRPVLRLWHTIGVGPGLVREGWAFLSFTCKDPLGRPVGEIRRCSVVEISCLTALCVWNLAVCTLVRILLTIQHQERWLKELKTTYPRRRPLMKTHGNRRLWKGLERPLMQSPITRKIIEWFDISCRQLGRDYHSSRHQLCEGRMQWRAHLSRFPHQLHQRCTQAPALLTCLLRRISVSSAFRFTENLCLQLLPSLGQKIERHHVYLWKIKGAKLKSISREIKKCRSGFERPCLAWLTKRARLRLCACLSLNRNVFRFWEQEFS